MQSDFKSKEYSNNTIIRANLKHDGKIIIRFLLFLLFGARFILDDAYLSENGTQTKAGISKLCRFGNSGSLVLGDANRDASQGIWQ
ncbi:MAG: hypothetical protein IPJ74_15105 [Saprospiraceae bacterium]|nr:hypothetical protein [Saprospiraceae bacterium]